MKIGLRQRIALAATANEVEALLKEGKTYDHASAQTRRSWDKAAKRALKRIERTPTPKEVRA